MNKQDVMKNQYQSLADRHPHSRGFALLECLVILLIITLLLPIHLSNTRPQSWTYYTFPDGYLLKQSESICRSDRFEYVTDDQPIITFNEHGNVNKARTLTFKNFRKIIIELGGGRLVFR